MEGPPGLAMGADIAAAVPPKGSIGDELGHLVGANAKNPKRFFAVNPFGLFFVVQTLEHGIQLGIQVANGIQESVFQSL